MGGGSAGPENLLGLPRLLGLPCGSFRGRGQPISGRQSP